MKFSAERLRIAMEEKGLTMRTLGRTIGRFHQTVNSWTLGDSVPNADDMPKLAVALDKSISFFYEEPDNPVYHPSDGHQTAEVAPGATNAEAGEE